jgi:hypothetical protein
MKKKYDFFGFIMLSLGWAGWLMFFLIDYNVYAIIIAAVMFLLSVHELWKQLKS